MTNEHDKEAFDYAHVLVGITPTPPSADIIQGSEEFVPVTGSVGVWLVRT
jgi:hypothetical protein